MENSLKKASRPLDPETEIQNLFVEQLSKHFEISKRRIVASNGIIQVPFDEKIQKLCNLFTATEEADGNLLITIFSEEADLVRDIRSGELFKKYQKLFDDQQQEFAKEDVLSILEKHKLHGFKEHELGAVYRSKHKDDAVSFAKKLHERGFYCTIENEKGVVVHNHKTSSDRVDDHVRSVRNLLNRVLKESGIFQASTQSGRNAEHSYSRQYVSGGIKFFSKKIDTIERINITLSEKGFICQKQDVIRQTSSDYEGCVFVKYHNLFEKVVGNEVVSDRPHKDALAKIISEAISVDFIADSIRSLSRKNAEFQDEIIKILKSNCPEKLQVSVSDTARITYEANLAEKNLEINKLRKKIEDLADFLKNTDSGFKVPGSNERYFSLTQIKEFIG